MARRLTFNRDRCLACRSCELACAVVHSQSGELHPAIDEQPAPRRRVAIALGPRGVAALRCSQCDEPLCVFSCKSGALYRRVTQIGTGPQSHAESRGLEAAERAAGGIEFDEERCVGCLMCYMVCAHGVRPAFAAIHRAARVWDPASAGFVEKDRIVRCDVCADRETPACVSACPTKALSMQQAEGGRREAAAFSGHIVVVGSSAAGIAACEAAREFAPDCRITMVTADSQWYSRPLLPYVLAGTITSASTTPKTTPGVISRDALAWRTQDHLANLRVEVMARTRAMRLDTEKRNVLVARVGEAGQTSTIPFDRLVIATGARATTLRVPGAELAGVFTLREQGDLDAIEALLAARNRRRDQGSGIRGTDERLPPTPDPRPVRAVVVGGGNVGLQAAEALARRGLNVTVVVRSQYLLSQMLDEEAGRRVGALFERHGVALRTGRDVAEISGDNKVQRVRLACPERHSPVDPSTSSGSPGAASRGDKLRTNGVEGDDGESIEADLVIVGKGIQPNVEWLRSSGVRIGRGVIADRTGHTNIDDVFAAGDCAEVRDPVTGDSIVSGIWPIAYEMGRAAGAAAVGAERPLAGALRMNSSKFFGTSVISIGEVRADRVPDASETIVTVAKDVYRKLVMKDGRLIGAVLYGDVSDAGMYYRLYRDGTPLDEAPEDLERTRSRRVAAMAEQMSV